MTLQLTSVSEPPTPWRGVVLVGAFALWPLVAWGGHLGHAPLVALAGLLTLADWSRARATTLLLLLAALLGWAVLSTAWSTAPTGGFTLESYEALEQRTWLKLVLQTLLYLPVVFAAAALSERWTDRVATTLSLAAVGLAALLLFEAASGARLYLGMREAIGDPYRPDLGMRNVSLGLYPLAVFVWPVLAILSAADRRRLLLIPIVCCLVAPPLFGAWSPLFAFLVGAGVFCLVRAAPVRPPRLLGYAAAAAIVLTPLAVRLADESGLSAELAPRIGLSWAERLRIWTFTADQISTAPFFGQGLDASRLFGAAVPLHPHNAGLQIWLELGAVGAALAALLWVALFQAAGRVGREDRGATAAACAAAAAYFTIGGLSFGVWQEWWLAIGALGAAAVVVAARYRDGLGLGDGAPIFETSEPS
jgi:O-antigen ligase